MDFSARFLIWQTLAILLFALPVLIAGAFAFAWRRALGRPWSFLALGSCCLFVAYIFIGELLFVPAFDAVIFVPTPGSERAAHTETMWPFFRELAPTPLVLLLIAYPVLKWLSSLLPNKEGM